QKALSLDDRNENCHMMVGEAFMYLGKFDLAGSYIDKAVALNPNNVICAAVRASLLFRVGRSAEAIEILDQVMKRDPLPPPWFWELRSEVLFLQKRYEEVIESTNRKNPMQYWDYAYLAAAKARLGKDAEARTDVAEVLRMKLDFSIAAYAMQTPFKNPADR